MGVHIVIDFMYLYYKYLHTINSGRIRRLTAKIPDFRTGGLQEVEFDISKIYYPIREIEGIRRGTEELFQGDSVTLSICFDSPSKERKEADSDYKSNRSASRLEQSDFDQIGLIKQLLAEAGYNVYKLDGAEADDIIYNLIRLHSDNFEANIIYTPDTDLMVNIKDNVGIKRYKWARGGKDPYTIIHTKNYEQYTLEEFGVRVPYNAIMLFKSLCGDKSDKVAGIKGFGPAAFNRFITYCEDYGVSNWQCMKDADCVANLIRQLKYFNSNEIEQALHSLELVKPRVFDVDAPESNSNIEKRRAAYEAFGMKSLIK